jgi:hypothetical protein
VENSLHGDLGGMIQITLFLLLVAGVFALAGRGAIAIYGSRSSVKDNGASTTTAERLAAMIEGDDIEDLTIEERILALATGLKNVKHSQNMLTGRLNKLSPPAEKGKGNGADVVAPERPRSRADVYKDWRSRNAR